MASFWVLATSSDRRNACWYALKAESMEWVAFFFPHIVTHDGEGGGDIQGAFQYRGVCQCDKPRSNVRALLLHHLDVLECTFAWALNILELVDTERVSISSKEASEFTLGHPSPQRRKGCYLPAATLKRERCPDRLRDVICLSHFHTSNGTGNMSGFLWPLWTLRSRVSLSRTCCYALGF